MHELGCFLDHTVYIYAGWSEKSTLFHIENMCKKGVFLEHLYISLYFYLQRSDYIGLELGTE